MKFDRVTSRSAASSTSNSRSESAGSVGRGTEERPFTETALSACARARRAVVRLTRRLARRRIVVVGGVAGDGDILIFDPIMAASM
jgi:hypothetical protein